MTAPLLPSKVISCLSSQSSYRSNLPGAAHTVHLAGMVCSEQFAILMQKLLQDCDCGCVYRYTASMALYGVSILFVSLVVAASLANFHFGTNLSTILLCEFQCVLRAGH